MTANCAYLVVIAISVTRLDVLLSCEAAVRKHISYIHPTLIIAIMLLFAVIGLFLLHRMHTEVKRGQCRAMRYMTISQWRPLRRDHSAAAAAAA